MYLPRPVGVSTTTANVHDSKQLGSVLEKVEDIHTYEGVNGDKGYKVPDNDALLEELNLKNRLQPLGIVLLLVGR